MMENGSQMLLLKVIWGKDFIHIICLGIYIAIKKLTIG